jgi:hypothetical protein
MDSRPILAGLTEVTGKWTRQRKAEERSVRYRSRRDSMWAGPARTPLKTICFEAMPEVWMKASGGGRLPTHWRQMFYVARGIVDGHPDSDRPLLDKTFKAILEEYLQLSGPGWDILYGARGVLKEPHDPDRKRVIPLSTADVRNYLRKRPPGRTIEPVSRRYPTHGATNCYGAILICEKEGFDELLEAEHVDDRFDIALMSTKGISARAARDLAASLAIPCFTLHDFDKNGFVMAAGFWGATDIGLRLSDVEELGLQGEMQRHRNPDAAHRNLIKNGATAEEADFIAGGTRVELNELPGDEFIAFVERKLERHNVEKVVPDQSTLDKAWWRANAAKKINGLIEEANKRDGPPPPADLEDRLREQLEADPQLSWSEAMLEMMDEEESPAW